MTDITNLTVLTASRPGQNAAAPPSHAIPPLTFLGNPATQFAAPSTITMADATAMLDLFTSTLQGLVPPPGAAPPTYVLQANGQWVPQEAAVGNVLSVFGRTGTVVAQTGDYSFAEISGTVAPTQLPVFTTTAIGAVPAPGSAIPATYVLSAAGTWVAPPAGGSGTVTSVAATVPTGLAVAGSPITTSGTLALSWSGTIPNAQVPTPTTSALGGVQSGTAPAGQFVTGVSTSGALTFGTPAQGGGGTVTSVGLTAPTGLAVSGSPVTTTGTLGLTWSGTIPNAQVPTPTASALGGVQSATAPANQFATGINTSGVLTFAQPSFANISGTLATSQLPAGTGTVTSVAATVPTGLSISGSPITTSGTLAVTWSGTIPNAQVPAPTASALGGVTSSTAPANQFATGITTAGAVTYAQPAFSNLSGTATIGQVPTATTAQIQNNTPSLVLSTDQTWGAVSPVTFATTGAVTLNLNNGIDWQPTANLTGNVTISFSNPKPGQAGVISVVAGSFTVAWGGSVVLPSSGAPAANTTGPTDYWYWCDRNNAVHVNKAL
jgi:hypothetical protein